MPTSFPVNLLLDSGAFSAWRQGVRPDLDDYIAFILSNREYLGSYVNMDVIPGSWGCSPEESAQQSWAHLKYMEEHGLHPDPVFHQGEPIYCLERLIDAGYTRIGISPDNNLRTSARILLFFAPDWA